MKYRRYVAYYYAENVLHLNNSNLVLPIRLRPGQCPIPSTAPTPRDVPKSPSRVSTSSSFSAHSLWYGDKRRCRRVLHVCTVGTTNTICIPVIHAIVLQQHVNALSHPTNAQATITPYRARANIHQGSRAIRESIGEGVSLRAGLACTLGSRSVRVRHPVPLRTALDDKVEVRQAQRIPLDRRALWNGSGRHSWTVQCQSARPDTPQMPSARRNSNGTPPTRQSNTKPTILLPYRPELLPCQYPQLQLRKPEA